MVAIIVSGYLYWRSSTFNADDIAALERIKQQNGSYSLGWLPYCYEYWEGVTWTNPETDRRVVRLVLPGKHLSGVLDLEGLSELRTLYVSSNDLSGLKVPANNKLKYLDLSKNKLKELDTSALNQLIVFECNENTLERLEVGHMLNLIDFRCENNRIRALNVQPLKELKTLYCFNNGLYELDVRPLSKLEDLRCDNNLLRNLSLGEHENLKVLLCQSNDLPSIEVTRSPNLAYLDCTDNNIETLDVSGLDNLEILVCSDNRINRLEGMAGKEKLEELWCESNRLTELDISSLNSLRFANCEDNPLTLLRVTPESNTKITLSMKPGNSLKLDSSVGWKPQENSTLLSVSEEGRLFSANPIRSGGRVTLSPANAPPSSASIQIKVTQPAPAHFSSGSGTQKNP